MAEGKRVVVVGAGPGGYAAAFRAADNGCRVTLVDPEAHPGGVCLHRGCIPSKALLHVAKIVAESAHAEEFGVTFAAPAVDAQKLDAWKRSVVDELVGGLSSLADARGVERIRGRASFVDSTSVVVDCVEPERRTLSFDAAIIATGSRPVVPPPFRVESDRVVSSTGALEVGEIPESLLVVGGGYIGLELGSVYAALGVPTTLVEMADRMLVGADEDLVRPLAAKIRSSFKEVRRSRWSKATARGSKRASPRCSTPSGAGPIRAASGWTGPP